MSNLKTKFYFSQKLQLSETEIDESLLPVLQSNENLEQQFLSKMNEMKNLNESLIQELSNRVQPVYYENSKAAFWGNFGKFGSITFAISWSIILCYWIFAYKELHSIKYKNLERLSNIIEVKEDNYFIPNERFIRKKNGIILIERNAVSLEK